MGSQTARIDGLVGSMAGMQAAVGAQLETINTASSVAMSTMLSTSTAQMSTMAAQNSEQMRTANSSMVANMARQQAMINAVVTTMNTSVNAAVSVARAAGSPTVYVQWGRKSCTAPRGLSVTKFYDGWTWGSRHDQSGGGGNTQCFKNEGRNRQGNANDASDLIVPLRQEYGQYTGVSMLAQTSGRNVPCSKCECKATSGTLLQLSAGQDLVSGHNRHHGGHVQIRGDKLKLGPPTDPFRPVLSARGRGTKEEEEDRCAGGAPACALSAA